MGMKLNFSTLFHQLHDLLRSCVLDFGDNWDSHLHLVESSQNNSYHFSIQIKPFEALYGRHCRFPIIRVKLV